MLGLCRVHCAALCINVQWSMQAAPCSLPDGSIVCPHRERASHIREAKTVANRVQRAHMDPAAKEAQKAREEDARARRQAANISKEVCAGQGIGEVPACVRLWWGMGCGGTLSWPLVDAGDAWMQ